MYKIRFNLGAGKNYLKWQIKSPEGVVTFHEPDEVTIFMYGCYLRNQKGTAQKIFDGADKSVCAWIECDYVKIAVLPIKNIMSTSKKISYNPRVTPNWELDGKNVDSESYDCLFTSIRNVIKGK